MSARNKFHTWLATQGYRDDIKPMGSTYPSSHVQALWECWLAAIESVKEVHKEAIWQAQVDASREAS
jgi:hypothetical protein